MQRDFQNNTLDTWVIVKWTKKEKKYEQIKEDLKSKSFSMTLDIEPLEKEAKARHPKYQHLFLLRNGVTILRAYDKNI